MAIDGSFFTSLSPAVGRSGKSNPKVRKSRGRILFVHGMWGGSWYFSNWMHNVAEQGWEACAVNLLSEDSPFKDQDLGSISVNDYAEEVAATVKRHEIDVVVGHSMGGLIAQKVASITYLRAAVFVASAPPKGITVISFKLLRSMLKYWWPMLANKELLANKEDLFTFMMSNMNLAEAEGVIGRFKPESGRAAREMALSTIHVGKINCPTLVFGGWDDPFTPASSQVKIALRHGSTLCMSRNSGHMPMIEPDHEKHWLEIYQWLNAAT